MYYHVHSHRHNAAAISLVNQLRAEQGEGPRCLFPRGVAPFSFPAEEPDLRQVTPGSVRAHSLPKKSLESLA